MGDIADDIIDQMISGHWFGGSTFSSREYRRPATRVTCKYCGASNLRWQNVKGGAWRVHEKNGGLHRCKAIKHPVSRFRDVETR